MAVSKTIILRQKNTGSTSWAQLLQLTSVELIQLQMQDVVGGRGKMGFRGYQRLSLQFD